VVYCDPNSIGYVKPILNNISLDHIDGVPSVSIYKKNRVMDHWNTNKIMSNCDHISWFLIFTISNYDHLSYSRLIYGAQKVIYTKAYV